MRGTLRRTQTRATCTDLSAPTGPTSGIGPGQRTGAHDLDHPRVAALAELDPTGIGSAPVGLLNHFLRSGLERCTQELYERVVQSFYQLTEINRDLIERLAPAALGLTSLGVV